MKRGARGGGGGVSCRLGRWHKSCPDRYDFFNRKRYQSAEEGSEQEGQNILETQMEASEEEDHEKVGKDGTQRVNICGEEADDTPEFDCWQEAIESESLADNNSQVQEPGRDHSACKLGRSRDNYSLYADLNDSGKGHRNHGCQHDAKNQPRKKACTLSIKQVNN